MDWDSTPEFSSLQGFDFELGIFVDPNISGDDNVGELAATPSDNHSLMVDLFTPVLDVGGNIGEPILHSNLNYQDNHQFIQSTDKISEDYHVNSGFEAINLYFETIDPGFETVSSEFEAVDYGFEAIAENHGPWEVETPTGTWTSSTVALSPSDSSFSMSPFNPSQCQLPELSKIPPIITDQPEYFAPSMQQAPMYQQAVPPQYPQTIQDRRRRHRKPLESLKRNQRKESKPEKCYVCENGYAYGRERDRHMVSNHRKEAERLGLDVSKTKCRICDMEFDRIRSDRLTKHMKNKHPSFL